MKKILFLSISIMCILFLSACSGSEPNSYDKETSSGTTIDTVNEKETPSPSSNASGESLDFIPEQYAIGSTIKFGGYEWLVLDVRDGKALLLTKEIIALKFGNISHSAEEALITLASKTMPSWRLSDFEGYTVLNTNFDGIYEAYQEYATAHPDIFTDDMWYTSWENCSLRKWLNSELDFTANEWEMIETTEVIDKTGIGANTMDKVFLLDADDVEKYFPRNESRGASIEVSDEEILHYLQNTLLVGALTGDLAEKVLDAKDDGIFYWWVRGSENDKYFLKPMSTDDELYWIAPSLEKPLGIRPAIWIKIVQ